MRLNKKHLSFLIVFISIFAFVLYSYFTESSNSPYLKIVFLDVGQGDSVYIEAPNGKQILVDGGPDSGVLESLADVMPVFDKSIDVVIATHADADHIGGLPSVIENYDVSLVLENGYVGSTKTYKNFEDKIVEKNIKKEIARKGMHIVLDEKENIYLDILFPDRDVSRMKTNDGSIVGRLSYKDRSVLLTGDATLHTESLVLQNENNADLKSDILKLGHHGSNTSSGVGWLKAVSPSVAVISAGLNNKYGHPHKDVLSRLDNLGIQYLSTSSLGDIVFKTDGVNIWQ